MNGVSGTPTQLVSPVEHVQNKAGQGPFLLAPYSSGRPEPDVEVY